MDMTESNPESGTPEEAPITLRLVQAARGGDVAAFAQAFDRVAPALFAWASLRVRASLRRRLDPERPFFPWFYQILRRLCFNFLRDRKLRHGKLDTATPWLVAAAGERAAVDRPDRAAERDRVVRRLREAVEALPDHERETFVLREYEGLRYREIAEMVGIPQGTVMSRLYNARKRLARQLEDVR